MINKEREIATRHTRKPPYTKNPINFNCQSRNIFNRKVSEHEAHGNLQEEDGVLSPNNSGGHNHQIDKNPIKFSKIFHEVLHNMDSQPLNESSAIKKNTIPQPSTPRSRRCKNLSQSRPQDDIRPGRQMNGRLSQDFRFSITDNYESEGDVICGDGSPSPSPITGTMFQGTKESRRQNSISKLAYPIRRSARENTESASSRSQYDQKMKKKTLVHDKSIFDRKGTIRKQSEILKKPIQDVKINTAQASTQKGSFNNVPMVCSKAQKKNEIFADYISKEFFPNSGEISNYMSILDQDTKNPWSLQPSNDKSSGTTLPISIIEKLDKDQSICFDSNKNWQESIILSSENLTTSPKLTTQYKSLETGPNSPVNSPPKNQSQNGSINSPRISINDKNYLPKQNTNSLPTLATNSLPYLESEQTETVKYQENPKLGDLKSHSTCERLHGTSNRDDLSEVPKYVTKESCNNHSNKRSLASEKQSLADTTQKKGEKSGSNPYTDEDPKKKRNKEPSISSTPIIPEKKLGLKNSSKHYDSNLEIDPEDRVAAEARLFEPQPVESVSEVNSISAISPSQSSFSTEEIIDEGMRLNSYPLSSKTPKIIGAYIETPITFSNLDRTQKSFQRRDLSLGSIECERGISFNKQMIKSNAHSSSLQTHLHERTAKPPALSNIINTAHRITASEDLRLIKLEENIEDSDLDSFIEKVANINEDIDCNELIMKLSNSRFLDPEIDWDKVSLSQVGNKEFLVNHMMERMKHKLNNASRGFHDIKLGLERLEQRVASTCSNDKNTLATKDSKYKKDYNATQRTSPISWFYIRVAPPRPNEKSRLFRNRNWKLTWLGLSLLMVLFWCLVELAMCKVFCHPKYSNKNTWQPSDPFFPWAIPTQLDKWTGRIISRSIKYFLEWFHRSSISQERPTHSYSGYDWWEGRSGPAASIYSQTLSNFDPGTGVGVGVGNIDDDEILI